MDTKTTVQTCDNKSVGIIVRDATGAIAILKRAKPPVGYSPVAGHVDDHGSVAQAAIDEVFEEIGLTVLKEDLQPTRITNRRFNNACRRPGGSFHDWWVFIVDRYTGILSPSADETKGADWYTPAQVQQLAERTYEYRAGHISEEDWKADPGLEEIWVEMLRELTIIR